MKIKNDDYLLEQLEVGAFGTNCYIIACAQTKEAAVIDPGGSVDCIWQTILDEGLKVKAIINTHSHFDHITGNKRIQSLTGAPIMIHEIEAPYLSDSDLNLGSQFGKDSDGGKAGRLLEDGSIVKIGNLELKVLFTPGHSPGGISLAVKDLVFSGDALFYRSIGRTDFRNGDYDTLIASVKDKLFQLPDDTKVYPGHGPSTTIGEEKKLNPYLRS